MNASGSRLDVRRELVYPGGNLGRIAFDLGGEVFGTIGMLQAYVVSLIPMLRFRVAGVLQQSRGLLNLLLGEDLAAARAWVSPMPSDAGAV